MTAFHQTRPNPSTSTITSPTSEPGAEASDSEPPEPGGIESFVIDIVVDDEDWSSFGDTAFGEVESVVTAAANAVAASPELNSVPCEVTIALSSDHDVAQLNGAFRSKPTPTNVLSFPASLQPHMGQAGITKPLGDIIIARETVMAEAADLGLQPSHHLAHLVVHGLLHLLGYDHETDEQAETMEAMETRILATLGISDPYENSDPILVGIKPTLGEA